MLDLRTNTDAIIVGMQVRIMNLWCTKHKKSVEEFLILDKKYNLFKELESICYISRDMSTSQLVDTLDEYMLRHNKYDKYDPLRLTGLTFEVLLEGTIYNLVEHLHNKYKYDKVKAFHVLFSSSLYKDFLVCQESGILLESTEHIRAMFDIEHIGGAEKLKKYIFNEKE